MRITSFVWISILIIPILNEGNAFATLVPPLERAPASDLRLADSFGRAITGTVKTGQQVQIAADLENSQEKVQPFAYIVQVTDASGVVVSLSWLSGSLDPNQSISSSQSWLSQHPGNYTAEVFVWSSVNNPDALSPPLKISFSVS